MNFAHASRWARSDLAAPPVLPHKHSLRHQNKNTLFLCALTQGRLTGDIDVEAVVGAEGGVWHLTDGPLVTQVGSMALLTDVRAKERTLITQLNSTHTPNYTLAHRAGNTLGALQLTLHKRPLNRSESTCLCVLVLVPIAPIRASNIHIQKIYRSIYLCMKPRSLG